MKQTQAEQNETAKHLFERTRDQIKSWGSARLDDLQERSAVITERRDDLRKQGEDLLRQGGEAITAGKAAVLDRKADLIRQRDEAARAGRETLLQLEATALESARDLLLRAEELVGPNASFLARGRSALDDAIVTVRSAHQGGLPIDDFDTLSIAKITPLLDALSPAELRTVRAYEAANKARKTMLREIDARLGPAPA